MPPRKNIEPKKNYIERKLVHQNNHNRINLRIITLKLRKILQQMNIIHQVLVLEIIFIKKHSKLVIILKILKFQKTY